jgi:hypothetical protein
MNISNKVTAEHMRSRRICTFDRSTMRQVHENRESTARQYDLRHLAQAPDGLPVRSSSDDVQARRF